MTVGTAASFAAAITGGSGDTVSWSSEPAGAVSFNPATSASGGSVSGTVTSSSYANTNVKVIATITGGQEKAEVSIPVSAASLGAASLTTNLASIGTNGTATLTLTKPATVTSFTGVNWTVTTLSGSNVVRLDTISGTATTNTVTGLSAGKVSIKATLTGVNGTNQTVDSNAVEITVTAANPATLRGNPANTNPIYLDNWTNSTGTGYLDFSVSPYVNGVPVNPVNPMYTWSVNNTPVANYYYSSYNLTSYNGSLHYGNTANTVSCKATFTYDGKSYETDLYTWTVYTGYNNHLASVSVPNSYTYALGDKDDAGNSSIVDQLASRYNYNTGYGTLSYVKFRTTTHTYGTLNASTTTSYYPSTSTSSYYVNYLGNVVFTPSGGAGKAIFTVELYYTNSTTPLSGTICIDTSGTTTTGDINYAASIGDTQYFNAADFESLYYDKTNGGTLSYVTFSTPSSGTGTLYADGVRLSTGTYCYASPSSRQTALDSVYFTPSGSTATRAGTVRIGFTAYGNRGSSSSYYNRTITGTVVINYLNGTAKDITYTPVGGSVTLKASDFTDKYREVVGSSAPSDLTIQFQDVPANGSLSYRNSSSSSSSTVSLRSSNIKSYRFTTRTSGANQLGDVTYTSSGTRSDTISYIAYSGSTARFSGKVVFNPNTASTTLTVGLPCTGSAGVAFNAASFTLANPAVMANCSQIRFMAPTNGTLTYAGAAVSYSGVTVLVSMLGQIHYKPNAGFNNNTDRVAFICYDAAGNQIGSGQVNIVVSGNTGGASGGVTNIGGFTDLPKDGSGDWYMSVLSSLVSRGIVQGTGNGKAEPRGKLNYGQALKMILLAANYPAQTEVAGNDWAINYKNLAVQNGLISSSVVLTDPITRDAVVELAAKALKIAPVTGNSPFKDSNNGYAIALNRTNPQIIVGNANGTFNGSGTLLRQEVWMIIYRMYEYSNSQSSTQMPDGI